MLPVRFSCGFFKRDVHVAVRAGDFFPDGVGGEFDMSLAKEAGHFQEIGFAQNDDSLAMGAGDFLADILAGELDVSTAGGTGHFSEAARQGTVSPHG